MDRLLQLLAKKHSGTITPKEQLELLSLLNDANSSAVANSIEEIFSNPLKLHSVSEEYIDDSFKNVKSKINTESKYVVAGFSKHLKIAATIAFFMVCITILRFTILKSYYSQGEEMSIVQTKKGSKTNLTLPDGSKVWINADSKLTYDESFGKTTRDVTLVGEAFFEVAKDKARPFIVHTKAMNIKVLGTVFNVRAYLDETTTQTSLLEGLVDVYLNQNGNKKISLNPNEKIIIHNNTFSKYLVTGATNVKDPAPGVQLSPLNIDAEDSTVLEAEWIKNKLILINERFEDVIPMIEKWYNVNVVVKKKPDGNIFYNGKFENDSLEDVLLALKLSGGFNYKVDKNTVTIY